MRGDSPQAVDSGPLDLPLGKRGKFLARFSVPPPKLSFNLESHVFERTRLRRVSTRDSRSVSGSLRELVLEGLVQFRECDLGKADRSFRPTLGYCSAQTPILVDTGSEIFCVAPESFFPPGSLVPADKRLSILAVNGSQLGGGDAWCVRAHHGANFWRW